MRKHKKHQTSVLGLLLLVVFLAHQAAVVEQIELISCIQLVVAHETSETLHVIHTVLSLSYNFGWRDRSFASCTFCAVTPEKTKSPTVFIGLFNELRQRRWNCTVVFATIYAGDPRRWLRLFQKVTELAGQGKQD